MKKILFFSILVVATYCADANVIGAGFVAGRPLAMLQSKLTEKQKIEYLIAQIAKQDAVFIRNGSEYTPSKAAEHLRMKYNRAGDIQTALQFIEKLGTSSSMSGKPYMMRYKNGKTVKVGEWLKAELLKLEKPSK